MKLHPLTIFALTARALAQVAGSWQLVPSPNAGPIPDGCALKDVAALSANDVWAVGTQPNQSQYLPAPLALHWDGSQWLVVATPSRPVPAAMLNSIVALAPNDAWAVGYTDAMDCGLCAHSLIEHWGGTQWSIVPSPNPGWSNLLSSISASSPTDIWAVGYQWLDWSTWAPLVLHYDGSTWTGLDLSATPFGQLESVFARSASDAWAVGVVGTSGGPGGIQPLAFHWNGASWSRAEFPTEPGGYTALRAVSGVAANDVWAVGVFKYTNQWGHEESLARAFHWDGAAWSPVLPGVFGRDSRMYDVHAISADNAWAVGGEPVLDSDIAFRYVTVHWDGATWSRTDNPNQGVLYAVTATPSSDAWAVGQGFGEQPGTHTLRFAPCGTADFDCDGEGGTDADIEAFFACLAGNCPAVPCPSSADFDGDGDTATDADIEAFFRVLAGGAC